MEEKLEKIEKRNGQIQKNFGPDPMAGAIAREEEKARQAPKP